MRGQKKKKYYLLQQKEIEEIKKLNKDLGIPSSFKEQGIDEQEFLSKVDMLADRAFEDQCTTANPRLPLVEELKQILIDSYYGNM